MRYGYIIVEIERHQEEFAAGARRHSFSERRMYMAPLRNSLIKPHVPIQAVSGIIPAPSSTHVSFRHTIRELDGNGKQEEARDNGGRSCLPNKCVKNAFPTTVRRMSDVRSRQDTYYFWQVFIFARSASKHTLTGSVQVVHFLCWCAFTM